MISETTRTSVYFNSKEDLPWGTSECTSRTRRPAGARKAGRRIPFLPLGLPADSESDPAGSHSAAHGCQPHSRCAAGKPLGSPQTGNVRPVTQTWSQAHELTPECLVGFFYEAKRLIIVDYSAAGWPVGVNCYWCPHRSKVGHSLEYWGTFRGTRGGFFCWFCQGVKSHMTSRATFSQQKSKPG